MSSIQELDADYYYISVLELVMASTETSDVFATIYKNLQRPEIQAEAQALLDYVPTSTSIGEYFYPQGVFSLEINDDTLIARLAEIQAENPTEILEEIPDSVLKNVLGF